MAPIEESTDQPLVKDHSQAAFDSQNDSANKGLDGAPAHPSAEKLASPQCDCDEQTAKDEQSTAIQTEPPGFIPFSFDTVDQGRDADRLEFNGSLINPEPGRIDWVPSRAGQCDNREESPAHLEEFKQFVERVKRKLQKSKEVFQQLSRNFVVPGTGAFHSQDATHGSQTDLSARDNYDFITSPVLSSPLRHTTSVAECNSATGDQSLAATGARQSFWSTPHRLPPSRPANAFPLTSSPFVSSSEEIPGPLEAVLGSAHEYEKLLEETLCFVEQVFLKPMQKLKTPQPDSGASGYVERFEETEEALSLRQTEMDLMEIIRDLKEQLAQNNFKLHRLKNENKCLREQVERLSSYRKERLEKSEEVNWLHKKLHVARNEQENAEEYLKLEQQRAESTFSDMMETNRALEDMRSLLYGYTKQISEQSDALNDQRILLEQYKKRISELHSDLATAKKNWKSAKAEHAKEISNCHSLRTNLEENSQLVNIAKQKFELISVFLLTFEEEQANENVGQCDSQQNLQIAGTTSDSFDEMAKNILSRLVNNCQEIKSSRAALKSFQMNNLNVLGTFTELGETVTEVKRQRDSQKERLTNLKHSILDAISTMKKLEPQRKKEVMSLNDLLKWVSCDWNNFDASDDKRSKINEFFKQNHDMRTELEDLIAKLIMIECLVGFPTPDESVGANSSALMSGSSFREEQESIVEESSEQSSAAQPNDHESLEALDSTLCSTLSHLVEFKLADHARRSAAVAEANATTDNIQKVEEELEIRIQSMLLNNCLQFEALQKQLKESERELAATKERLKNSSCQIITAVGELADAGERSKIIIDFEFGSDSQSDDRYVEIDLAPLRLLCRDELNIDGQGTVQLCHLLRCCSIAVKEYEKNRKLLSSLTIEMEVTRQQTKDEAQSKQTELVKYHNKMSELSQTLAQLSKDSLACTAKLNAVNPWSGSPDPTMTILHQTSTASHKFEENFMHLSNSVGSLTTAVEWSIKNFSTLIEQKNEMEKAHGKLLARVGCITAEVKKLQDEVKKREEERRHLCKRLDDKQRQLQELQERLKPWGNFIELEEPIMRQNLHELTVLGAAITECQGWAARALAVESVPARASDLGSQESLDFTVLDQNCSTAADQRLDPIAVTGRVPLPSEHNYTRRIAAVQEGATDGKNAAVPARQEPRPMQRTGISRVLSSGQTPSHLNTVSSPVTRIKLSESLYRQLAAAPDASMPRLASASSTAASSPGVLPGPHGITCGGSSRGVCSSPPSSPLLRRADDGGCPRGPVSRTVLPIADGWMPRLVVCCVSSIAVVWYMYSKRPFLE